MIVSNKSKLLAALAFIAVLYAVLTLFIGVSFSKALEAMIMGVIVLPASIGVAGYTFRYVVRERQALSRVRKNKDRTAKEARSLPTYKGVPIDYNGEDLVWYELKPQSIQSESAKITPEDMTSAIKSLGTKTGYTISQIHSRPVHSFVLRRTEDGIVSLYLGTSRLDAESSLQTFAQRIGYTIERMNGVPPIGYKGGYTLASRPKRIDHQAISDASKEIQGTISAFSGSRENKFVGNIIVTFEGAQDFEIRRFMANSNEQSIEYGGEMNKSAGGASGSASVGAKTSTLASTLLRTTFLVSADSSSEESSVSAFDNVATSMDSLPFIMVGNNVERWHRKNSLIQLSIYWVLLIILGLTSIVSTPLLIAGSIPAIAATIAIFLQPSWLVRDPMERSIQRGFIPVPISTRFSLRWFFSSIITSFRRNAGGSEKVDNEIGWPSCKEVVPFYASPMAELIMPHRGSMQNNQERERLPMVELERSYEGFDSDADIVVGVTSKKQPVNFSVNDQNFGIAGFGKPNSGKTNLMQIIFLRNAQLSVSRKDVFISPILFENKGQGAYDMWKWIKHMPGAEIFEINRPKSKYRLCIEGERLGDKLKYGHIVTVEDVMNNTKALLEYIQFAFDLDNAPRAMNNLSNAMFIAALLNREELVELELEEFLNINRPNLMRLALIILKGDSRIDISRKLDDLGNNLSSPRNLTNETIDEEERYRRAKLSQYIGQHAVTSGRGDDIAMLESAVNKIAEIADCPMFEPVKGQIEVSIGDLINKGAPSIINFGPYSVGKLENGSHKLKKPEREAVIGRTMKMVQKAYWKHCESNNSGWQSMSKFSQIYSDEASLFGITSGNTNGGVEDNVTSKIADQGRAFGSSQTLFTQRYDTDHISPGLRSVMLNSNTFFQFSQGGYSDAEKAINAIGGERNTPYTQDNILRMPMGVSIGFVHRRMQRTNTFTILTPPFEAIAPVIAGTQHGGNGTDIVTAEEIFKAIMMYYSRQRAIKKNRKRDIADRSVEMKKQKAIGQ